MTIILALALVATWIAISGRWLRRRFEHPHTRLTWAMVQHLESLGCAVYHRKKQIYVLPRSQPPPEGLTRLRPPDCARRRWPVALR